jgi:chemotaxis protein MotA
MDIATIIGLLLGTGLVLGSIAIGGSLGPFINIPSIMITIGGSFAALLINFPLKKVLGVFSIVRKCFTYRLPTTEEVIEQFMKFATLARRDGLLALENEMEEIDDGFLKRGLEMVVGGNSKEEITSILETEITYIEQRHQSGKKIMDALAAAAPAFGMIGTLIGLVQMLRTLDDPTQIGVGMATALLTTLYGAVIANLFCIPLAGKLETRSQEEVMVRELMVAGMVSLVEGHAPRVVEERLTAFLSPSSRSEVTAQAA